jgi:DNA-binding CsgD family transcriptional regulator
MMDEDRPAPPAEVSADSTSGPRASDAANRRWGDRPGKTPALTFARLLTTSPDLDEISRCLVGLLSWPIGATGALIVREQGGSLSTLARYEEPLDPNLEVLRGQESEPCVSEVVTATGGLSPVVWTEPGHPSCRPMAAWPLDTSNGHVDHLVIILGATEPAGTVRDRVRGIPEVLAVYLAGRDPRNGRTVADAPTAAGAAVHLSERQSRVLEMMAQELTMAQIASRIGYSESTVRMESLAIYRALGVHERRHAVAAARGMGLLPRDEPPRGG